MDRIFGSGISLNLNLSIIKLISSIDNDDTLTIYIESDDYLDGVVTELGLKFEKLDTIIRIKNLRR